jgi:DNA polymerase-3 subunit delta
MKIAPRDIDNFSKSPDPKARLILIYGPDRGLMKIRSENVAKSVVEDINDPFNVITLSVDKILEDPASLVDEANAISMLGGARLIRILDGSEKIVPYLKEYLQNPSPDNLILIEAGDLKPKSSLRKLCESSPTAAALPCYMDDERSIEKIIRQALNTAGLRIDSDATQWLIANISGDRQHILNEIEKLSIYSSSPNADNNNQTITLTDVQECIGLGGSQNFDDLIYNVAGGNPAKALVAYNALIEQGIPAVTLIRTLINHFMKLHYIKTMVLSGTPIEQALNKLTPKIFFKQKGAFISQVNKWNEPQIRVIISRLTEQEAACKTSGVPADELCAQALLSISKK